MSCSIEIILNLTHFSPKVFFVLSAIVALSVAAPAPDGDHAHDPAPAEAAAPAPAPTVVRAPVLPAPPGWMATFCWGKEGFYKEAIFVLAIIRGPAPVVPVAPIRVAAPFIAPAPIRVAAPVAVAPLRFPAVAAPLLPARLPVPVAPAPIAVPVAAPAPIYRPAPVVAPTYGPVPIEGPAVYNFAYGVADSLTGTNFGHSEDANGGRTVGSYYVSLPDGRLQTVNYSADDVTGYIADVQYSGAAIAAPAYAPAPAYSP